MTMKKYLYMILAAVLFAACEKDDDLGFGGENPTEDLYMGVAKNIEFHAATEKLMATQGICVFKGPNGHIFTREFTHLRENGKSQITLNKGLRDGNYKLLAFKVEIVDGEPNIRSRSEDEYVECYGMGCTLSVSGDETEVVSTYNEDFEMYGSGTESDPFVVSSYSHLLNLAELTNDANTNSMIDASYHYEQACDIDMDFASWKVADGYGWNPIGFSDLTPFRGHYHGKGYKITNLWSERDASSFVALFGCVLNTSIDSLTISNARIEGWFSSAALVGCAMTRGDARDVTYIKNCTVENSSICGEGSSTPTNNSMCIAGLIGTAERNAQLFIDGCEVASNNNIVGGYSVGGVLGGGSLFSTSVISNTVNRANISSFYAPCGGLVGSADSLFIVGCTNYGEITANVGGSDGEGATKLGAGGIIGGSGATYVLACSNYGKVQGHEGVGGIIGSTRICGNSENGEENCYSDAIIYNCDNEAAISGIKFVGGIAGEVQSTMYSVKNSGPINGNSYVGGIIGVSPVGALHNVVNIGNVVGTKDFIGGIVGNIIVGSLTSTQNFANVSTSGSYVGGLVGLSGSYFISHYCANVGNVSSTMQEAKIGGLIGEIGDPKSWEFSDTFRLVMSSLGVVFGSLNVCGAFKIIALARSSSANGFAIDYDLTFAQIGGLSEQSISSLTSPVRTVISDGEYSDYISRMTTSNDQKINGMSDLLSSTRSGYEIYQGFNQYNQEVLSYSTSETTSENFFNNLTYKLNERGEEVAGMEKTDTWVHAALSGVCFVAGLTCGGIASLPAFGTSAAVLRLLSASCTALTIANCVTWSCTNFAQNTTIVSQCVNSCTLQGEEKSSIGGLVGMMNEYSILTESLNLGSITDSSNRDFGQITTKAKSRSIVEDIVLVGDESWDHKDMESYSSSAQIADIYIWTDGVMPLAAPYYATFIRKQEDLGDEKTYKGLSLSDSNPHWIMSQYGDLTIPVPYRSTFAEY